MTIECRLPGCHRSGPTGILPAMQSNAHSVLEHVFGYHQFRGEQQTIIDTLIQGDDALVLMPTGGVNPCATRFRRWSVRAPVW